VTRRALVVAAALLGLLLMHGVGGHSAHAAEVHADAGHAGTSAHGSAHRAPASAHEASASTYNPTYDGPTATTTGCSTGCATDSAAPLPREVSDVLMTLCLTILLAAAVLLLGRAGPGLSALQPLRLRWTPAPARDETSRPPDLHALSILRC
jgi:hypothetical protein